MNQFSIVLLFVAASAEDVYDLRERSNWRLRGLCSELTPFRQGTSSQYQYCYLYLVI